MTTTSVALWTAKDAVVLPPGARTPPTIISHATQLSLRDKQQIVSGFEAGNYEMTMSYVWTKAMAALKRDLATVGMRFLGELLGKGDLAEDANPVTALSHEEAIMLAQELGAISSTEAMRLRHAYEQISHFVDADGNDLDPDDSMDEGEALLALKACVKNILGKQKIEVSTQFADFRSSLESRVFKGEDSEIQALLVSPYFFRKITLGILLNLARTNKGAQLENSLANLNVILPLLWPGIREVERWTVGTAYSEAYSAGAQTASAGLKSALLKVQGFDFVPENVRSHTFVKAAERLIQAHEQFNNFYNEPGPMRELRALGSTIPIPALPACATAVLCVRLGNSYGLSNAAQADATGVLRSLSQDRWEYYLNECLPTEPRILNKLFYEKPRNAWIALVKEFALDRLNVSSKVRRMVDATSHGDIKRITAAADQMRSEYYGKQ